MQAGGPVLLCLSDEISYPRWIVKVGLDSLPWWAL